MLAFIKSKNEQHDNLCEEILRERAAVLSRAGNAVSDALNLLARLEREIENKLFLLKNSINKQNEKNISRVKKVIYSEINATINKYNTVRETAELKYYYLLVTREALGLRRHDRVREIYKIPPKKKNIRTF